MRWHFGHLVALSVFIHLLAAVLVCAIAWSLAPLFARAASRPESGPAPGQPMTMELISDISSPAATAPPPAAPATIPLPETPLATIPLPTPSVSTPHPQAPNPALFVSAIMPVPSPVKPRVATRPVVNPTPKIVAANAIGAGKSQVSSPARVGMTGLPAPDYPPEALARKEGGTVGMQVAFGPDGRVTDASIFQSSGFSILDVSTRSFICTHWKNLGLANTTVQVPVIFDPVSRK